MRLAARVYPGCRPRKYENPRGRRAFVSCLLAFLASASLVSMSHQLALLWVGMEATTLAFAPLIFHRHNRRSLEAVWKYLVLSSVGAACARASGRVGGAQAAALRQRVAVKVLAPCR